VCSICDELHAFVLLLPFSGNGRKAIFRTANLDAVDIAKEFNQLCKVNDIQQPTSAAASVGTKSMSKSKK
jgi:hypothetical protein